MESYGKTEKYIFSRKNELHLKETLMKSAMKARIADRLKCQQLTAAIPNLGLVADTKGISNLVTAFTQDREVTRNS